MNDSNSFFQRIKPGIPKRYLLFVAAVVWTFAGGMLLFRDFYMLIFFHKMLWLKIAGSFVARILFFVFLFSKISFKHIQRIVNLRQDHPCLFSFFNLKSYILMSVMITTGIFLRKTGLIPLEYLSLFYIAMGTPLFISSLRFYYNGFNYRKVLESMSQKDNE